MNILVTGANGLLGRKLVELASAERGLTVFATGLGEDRNPAGNHQYLPLDVTSPKQAAEVFASAKPNVVVNAAAMTNVDQCETEREACRRLNVDAVKYLTHEAAKHHSFFIQLSTDFVFDGRQGPYDERARPNPLNYYGETKLASEHILLQSHLHWAVVRTVLVYGITSDMGRSNIILWVKESLEERRNISVVNDQWRTPTLAEDLAMGCFLIAKNRSRGIFHIAGKDLLTPYDMAVKTASLFGLSTETMQKANGKMFKQPAKRPAKTGFIIDKAKKVLGYAPRGFNEGLQIVSRQMAAIERGDPTH